MDAMAELTPGPRGRERERERMVAGGARKVKKSRVEGIDGGEGDDEEGHER
jgi:hypothetical protein